jgi:NDP-sugar pyrophosphorylase family protein
MKINSVILANTTTSYPRHLSESSILWDIEISPNVKLIERIFETYAVGDRNILVTNLISPDLPSHIEKIDVSESTSGALCTLALTVDSLDWNLPVLVVPADGLIPQEAVKEFLETAITKNYDSSTVCFKSNNPKYSYVRTKNDHVTEIAEKRVISEQATAGIFYFKSPEIMLSCVEWSIINNISNNGKFYIAPSLNKLITENKTIGIYKIDANKYFRFSTPEEASESRDRMR